LLTIIKAILFVAALLAMEVFAFYAQRTLDKARGESLTEELLRVLISPLTSPMIFCSLSTKVLNQPARQLKALVDQFRV